MTLSLDDVRNKRFRLARKSGYEVAEVDDFLDQVQESFAQLIEENETLKKQVESLGTGEPAAVSEPAPRAPVEPERVVVTTSAEAGAAAARLLQMSTEQSDRLVAEATSEAERIRSEADAAARQLTDDSNAKAEQLQAEAREKAESLRADAQSRADELDADTARRREQLFGDLETERGLLSSAIDDLRRFEQSFRTNMAEHLRRHLNVLESGSAEPAELPELAPVAASPVAAESAAQTEASEHSGSAGEPHGGIETEGAGAEPGTGGANEDEAVETDPDATVQVSDTPRLDALLGDQR